MPDPRALWAAVRPRINPTKRSFDANASVSSRRSTASSTRRRSRPCAGSPRPSATGPALLMPAVPRSKPHPGQPRFRLGFYARGTTRLIEAPGCPVQHPLTLAAVALVSQALADTPVTATAPKGKGGWLHGIAARVDPPSGGIELTLIGRTGKLPGGKSLAARLASLPGVKGLHISVNPSRSSFLMGSDFVQPRRASADALRAGGRPLWPVPRRLLPDERPGRRVARRGGAPPAARQLPLPSPISTGASVSSPA